VQQVVYDEVPYIQVGKFASLSARSPALQGYTPFTRTRSSGTPA
jgi:peptide/nickel transport system substrate-binding protein